MSGVDLGTYHLIVKFADGRGYIEKWNTGRRFCKGTTEVSPLGADLIKPTWESEEDLLETMFFMYTDGNYSCDCNRILFLARAANEPEPEEVDCGETIQLESLTAIRPDGTEVELMKAGEAVCPT